MWRRCTEMAALMVKSALHIPTVAAPSHLRQQPSGWRWQTWCRGCQEHLLLQNLDAVLGKQLQRCHSLSTWPQWFLQIRQGMLSNRGGQPTHHWSYANFLFPGEVSFIGALIKKHWVNNKLTLFILSRISLISVVSVGCVEFHASNHATFPSSWHGIGEVSFSNM